MVLGEFKILNGQYYIAVNTSGTLRKVKCKLSWYKVVYLVFLNYINNGLHKETIEKHCNIK